MAIFHKKDRAKFKAVPNRISLPTGSDAFKEYQNNLPIRKQYRTMTINIPKKPISSPITAII